MASYELTAFDRRCSAISLVTAIDQQAPYTLNIGFWVTDPQRQIIWPDTTQISQQHYLWEHTCFEVFIGIKGQDGYREINLSPSLAWQQYQFEEYRYPEQMPPQVSQDIELVQLKRTHYGMNVSLDLTEFMLKQQLNWYDLIVATTAVIETAQGLEYFAMQHAANQPDFHNKRHWLHEF